MKCRDEVGQGRLRPKGGHSPITATTLLVQRRQRAVQEACKWKHQVLAR